MHIIENILVSDDILERKFACQLSACKGACCWEGDLGAPLKEEELPILDHLKEILWDDLTEKSKVTLKDAKPYKYYAGLEGFGTELNRDGSCVFLKIGEEGIAKCIIEEAYKNGKTDFQKPISCHLYPIRVESNPDVFFTALNYDEWDICAEACKAGESMSLPVYRFLKEPLIRAFGEKFYEALEAAGEYHANSSTKP
jgi:hypothetical protein